jgi:hypothetical protein
MEQNKQYEYDFDDFVESRLFDIPREHQEYMNRKSARGWEMVNVVTIKQYNTPVLRIYWKREKTTNIE